MGDIFDSETMTDLSDLSGSAPLRKMSDAWDAARFREHDAHTKAIEAREAYKDALCGVNYGV
jgi:hypothetical protein